MMTKRESLMERIATLPEELLDEVARSIHDIVARHQSGVYVSATTNVSPFGRGWMRRGAASSPPTPR
jgi:hypothetical protein